MASDKLAELLVPSLIERFDSIPAERHVAFEVSKGEIALLIKSQYQLHQGLALLAQAIGSAVFSDEGTRTLNEATSMLATAQGSFATATNALIFKTVQQAEAVR